MHLGKLWWNHQLIGYPMSGCEETEVRLFTRGKNRLLWIRRCERDKCLVKCNEGIGGIIGLRCELDSVISIGEPLEVDQEICIG
jgi:hypothetical protein